MGKSYKDKHKRNSSFDKRNKRTIKQGKSKLKFSVDGVGKKAAWDDEFLD